MNEDFLDFLSALLEAKARFLVVGAHALAVHGSTRSTEDLDVFVDRTHANAQRIWSALIAFGAPVETLGISPADFERPDQVIQIGVPPRRIDVLTGISGVTFEEAWRGRVDHDVARISVPFLGRDDLLKNKKASGRPKDLADIREIE